MKKLSINVNFVSDRELDMLLNIADSGLVNSEDLIDISIYDPEAILPAVKEMREAHGMLDSIPEYKNLFYHYTGEYDDF